MGCIDVYMKPMFYFGLTMVFTCLIAFIIYVYKYFEEKHYEKELQNAILRTNISQVDKLTPYEFEEWVARFLRIAGYKANATKKSGDYGVDVVAEKDNTSIAIQVKKSQNPLV